MRGTVANTKISLDLHYASAKKGAAFAPNKDFTEQVARDLSRVSVIESHGQPRFREHVLAP
jgi:hypothetical protein